MNTVKLREALADLQRQRDILDNAINGLRTVLAMSEPNLSAEAQVEKARPAGRVSYIEDGVDILRAVGKPLHVEAIVDKIKQLRCNTDILRGSVESSFLRHIKTQKARAKIAKMGRSTFGLAAWRNATAHDNAPLFVAQ